MLKVFLCVRDYVEANLVRNLSCNTSLREDFLLVILFTESYIFISEVCLPGSDVCIEDVSYTILIAST